MHKKPIQQKGITLIEVLIYATLLSVLMATSMAYAYGMYEQNADLMGDINDAYK